MTRFREVVTTIVLMARRVKARGPRRSFAESKRGLSVLYVCLPLLSGHLRPLFLCLPFLATICIPLVNRDKGREAGSDPRVLCMLNVRSGSCRWLRSMTMCAADGPRAGHDAIVLPQICFVGGRTSP